MILEVKGIAFIRIFISIIIAVITGATSAYMGSFGTNSIPNLLLGLSSAAIFLSFIFLLLSVYDFWSISKLDSELSEQAKNAKLKEDALSSIRGKI